MAKAKVTDQFANKAIQRITTSAADTLTFGELNFAAGVFQRIAIVIHRVVYTPGTASVGALVTSSDILYFAITVSNGITDLALTHPEIIDLLRMQGYQAGTAASGDAKDTTIIHDLSMLPGGGWIIPASPIYLAASSAGIGATVNCDIELDFTFRELADADYIELIQSRVKANV